MNAEIGHWGRQVGMALAMAATASVATAASSWALLPQPADMRLAPSGVVKIADGARVAVRAADLQQVQPVVDRFVQLVANTRGLQLHPAATSDAHPAITFEVDPHAKVAGDSGYRIEVGAEGIRVIARAPGGAFYGGVTLWQLLTPPGWVRGVPAEVAEGTIDDHPRFEWRALLLDSGRHFQSVADIEKLIDWMSLDKLNVLLWHVTEDQGWRLEIPKYPELTKTGACRKAVGLDIELTGAADEPYCGFYTEAQVREIVRYAADRFVTVVPEIDLPGHSQAAVAAYPWLGVTGKRPSVWTNWGISPWLLKPDEKTLQFVDDVLDEVMRLFPSKYISIGGDEADKQQWNASPELRERLQKLGLANMDQLQGWFMSRIADHLVEHGRRPVGWDDELVAGEKLPASQVVMTWHGNEVALRAAAQGHDVVMAPTASLYFDYYQSDLPDEWPGQPPTTTLRQGYDTTAIPPGATAADSKRVIGVQGNLWTEYVPTFARAQHALYPRIAALSEVGWSSSDAHDWNGFLKRLPAELARYRALGIGYADSAFAPAFDVTAGSKGMLHVALANQANFGEIRYTTDGSAPTSTSTQYAQPLEFSPAGKVTLRAATFASGGFELAATRTQVLDASTLLTRNSSELASCSNQPGSRLGGKQPAQGPRPVYKVNVGDMCWLWRHAPLAGIERVTLTVERAAWRFGDEAREAVVRPKAGPAGEFEIHADSCVGPLLARLPLAPAVPGDGQHQLNAMVSKSKPNDARDLCIVATGDPRDGQWMLARAEFSK
ncbi:MAG: family 20 glycosylhydrolase [Proteobacteria bacterium]|nr:family 20 glycosylhydrolase [Pseudomonadota bacterium]